MERVAEPTTTVEFAVEMNCQSCENTVRKALETIPGVQKVQVDFAKESVLIESSLPSSRVQELIEKTGRKAILRGIGSSGWFGINTESVKGSQFSAAVVEFYGLNGIKGVTRFVQLDENECVVDGTLDGLKPGQHGLAVCESGDLSRECESTGEHYNPHSVEHGPPDSLNGHVGDLGNISADENGRASFRFHNSRIKVWDLIGRSLAVHASADDYGKGIDFRSKIDGNAGPKIACGIIARSAGIMENTKKICACSGATLWEERDEIKRKTSTTGSVL